MPVVVKLSPDEVSVERNRGKSQRQIVNEQYDAMLEGFGLSDWGEVQLDANEKRATVRNRLKAAADRRGFGIRFKRGQGNQMRFEIVEKGAPGTESSDSDADAGADGDDGPQAPVEEPISSVAPPAPRRRRKAQENEEEVSDGGEPPAQKRRGRPKVNV